MRRGDASGEIPEMRWKPYHLRHPKNSAVLSEITSKGYFLDRLQDFDAQFFGISPREAEQMDPQQRLALEVTWEALEDAGIPPQDLVGSDTSVFMGVNSDDYGKLLLEDLPAVEAWMGVGTAYCGIPNRISYLLGLQGPSAAIDTACASSLCAIHHAKQSLMLGESSLAIAGGVNALVGPGLTAVLDKAGVLSKDGRCRSFDEAAAGYGRGEGAGIVVLKRLSDALADKDRIIAVLKGSASGANGKTNGIMAPDSAAQEKVARKALKESRCSGDSISYVEAHATSTQLGDPTEFAALKKVYGSGSRNLGSAPCYVGSIKPNIGHLEAGAGVMGFIKAAMIVNRSSVPPQTNLSQLNEKLGIETSMLEPVTEPKTLHPVGGPIRAAVASYGYGGSVAHAILEAPPLQQALRHLDPAQTTEKSSAVVLLLSGPSRNRTKASARHILQWLKDSNQAVDLASIAYTLAVKRGHHRFRTAVTTENIKEAKLLLEAVAQGKSNAQIYDGRAEPASESKGLVWVFSGHGAQWDGMGQYLMDVEPVFAETVKQIEPIVRKELGFNLSKALQHESVATSDRIQVTTFVMQVGLARVFQAKGVTPAACIGHSLGELAAAVVSGALSVEEGALVCCVRARLYRRVAGTGSMALINISANEATHKIGTRADVYVAIDSSPTSCVISGTPEAVKEFSTECEAENVQVRMVKSDIAFHTPLLSALVDPMRTSLATSVNARRPKIRLYSTSLTNPKGDEPRDLQYWINNMVKPVLLTSAIRAAADDGFNRFQEISSHPIVLHSINETLMEMSSTENLVIPTLLRNKDNRKSLLAAFGKLYCAGIPVALQHVLSGTWIHDLAGTVWEHQPHWRELASGSPPTLLGHDIKSHTLLGARTQLAGADVAVWQTQLASDLKPFPGNHPLHGSEIVPAAVLINTFLSAIPGHCLRNISLRVPVVVSPPRDIQVIRENQHLRICSRLVASEKVESSDNSWLVNTAADYSMDNPEPEILDISTTKSRLPNRLANSFSIDYLAKVGVPEMGFPWKVVEHLESDEEMLAMVDVDPTASTSSPHFGGSSWASLLDSATSISSTVFHKAPLLRMPTAVGRVHVLSNTKPPKSSYVHVRKAPGVFTANVKICDENGIVLIDVQNMAFAGIEGNAVPDRSSAGLIHRIAWPPIRLAEEPLSFSKVVFISARTSQLETYETQLASRKIQTQVLPEPKALSNVESDSIFVFLPSAEIHEGEIYEASAANCERLLDSIKHLLSLCKQTKLFVITSGALNECGTEALAQSSLVGLARIIHSEHAEVFAGLIDVEDSLFPLQAIKYAHSQDVIKVHDSVARHARLRPFQKPVELSERPKFRLHPQGTYLITGGLGALGLETAFFLARAGARRVILISRRKLPERRKWSTHSNTAGIKSILELESMGIAVHPVALDLTATGAAEQLQSVIDDLSCPPVLGVVHAAGTLANQMVNETTPEAFNSVIAPKIQGAMALHTAFPPNTVDFFVMFSSCGQLLGFPGQAAYAAGNSFLDCLATARRAAGDNSISMIWTSWRGLGMAASTRYIDAELAARGITDVTKEEAFDAWNAIFDYNTDHAVVLRTIPLDGDEPSPHPILDESLVRRTPLAGPTAGTEANDGGQAVSGAEREPDILQKVTQCVSTTLSMSPEDLDPNVALIELGMDSVMTVELRGHLQKALKRRVGPTLTWTCPTINLLAKHFIDLGSGFTA